MTMTKAVVFICFTVLSSTAGAQFNAIGRYNNISEFAYLLERCGALTAERRTWLKHVRAQALKSLDWSESRADQQEEILLREFAARYREVSRERCAETVRGVDLERATKFAP